MTRHILIGCTKEKADRPTIAVSMYRGKLFDMSLRFAQLYGGRRWILSAKHGVLRDFATIEPYNETLSTRAKRAEWNRRVVQQLLAITSRGDELVVLAGEKYAGWSDELVAAGRTVLQPLRGLGIGHRLSWLRRQIDRVYRGGTISVPSNPSGHALRPIGGE